MPRYKNKTPCPAPGTRFGRLVVQNRPGQSTPELNDKGQRNIYCVCDCGNYSTPTLHALLKGRSRSCGCRAHSIGRKYPTPPIGERHGRLEIVDNDESLRVHGIRAVMAVCDCQRELWPQAELKDIANTITIARWCGKRPPQSCGCIRSDHLKKLDRKAIGQRNRKDWSYLEGKYISCRSKLKYLQEVAGKPRVLPNGKTIVDRQGLFECDCGNVVAKSLNNTMNQLTKSCGQCKPRESQRNKKPKPK